MVFTATTISVLATVVWLLVAFFLFVLGAAIIGQPRAYKHRYNFTVEIDGVTSSGFIDCQGLKGNVGIVEHWEGGALVGEFEAGRVTFDNLVLTRGATDDMELYEWYKQVITAPANRGETPPNYKRNLDIVEWDRAGNEIDRWTVVDAFPVGFEPGRWDNKVDEMQIESVELKYKYFQKPTD